MTVGRARNAGAAERGAEPPDVDVVIVGGGPIGLYLACRLVGDGTSVRVFERRARPSEHSRAIGIHPPALEALASVDVADAMVSAGVPIVRGHAFSARRRLGTLSFADLPGPYRFVLSLPQREGERLLAERLQRSAPGALRRGVAVRSVAADAAGATVTLDGSAPVRTRLVVGADGHDAASRRWIGAAVRRRSFADRYLMGDTVDRTAWGSDAVIHLTGAGVVESFPLPGGARRWVVALGGAPLPEDEGDRAAALERWVLERTGEDAPADGCTMVSPFRAEAVAVTPWVRGRVVLVGDAAHVVPPFGGQGMNLGWLGADALADALREAPPAHASAAALAAALARYEERGRRAARGAARRAALNLRAGRANGGAPLRDALVWLALRPGLAGASARLFTMRGLERPAPSHRRPHAPRGREA